MRIRREQMEVFEQAAVQGLEQRLFTHLQECFPKHCQVLGEAAIRALIRFGCDRAAHHGFTAEPGQRLYLDLMLLLGSHFDEDPQLPWAAEILADRSQPDQGARAQRLHAKACEYLDRALGPNNQHLDGALRQIRQETLEGFARSGAGSFENYMIMRLSMLYPEKCQYIREDCLRNLIQRGVSFARSYGLTTERGVVLSIALMFFLGSAFDTDPQFPWAAAVLNEPSIPDPPTRANRLYAEALAYLDRWLA